MNTRQQYLNKECTHSEYYAQFVTEYTRSVVLSRISKKELLSAMNEDPYLNSIKLNVWDSLGKLINSNMKEYGDSLTLFGKVCILKEAARQICEESK